MCRKSEANQDSDARTNTNVLGAKQQGVGTSKDERRHKKAGKEMKSREVERWKVKKGK